MFRLPTEMADILNTLAELAAERVAEAKKKRSAVSLRDDAEKMPKGDFRFRNALKKDELAFICECKKASPSKGLIAPEFPYLQIAKEYEAAGADCISVLTEPHYFLGNDAYLQKIAATVRIPCLRKDFTVDSYMIYEAKLLGASAVLLICSILDSGQLREYLEICSELGLSALVEAHSAQEIEEAVLAGAEIIGVNNRNLKDFSVDRNHAVALRQNVPPGILYVVESGIQNAADVQAAREAGADAVLIGETLMRATDKTEMLRTLKGQQI